MIVNHIVFTSLLGYCDNRRHGCTKLAPLHLYRKNFFTYHFLDNIQRRGLTNVRLSKVIKVIISILYNFDNITSYANCNFYIF